eukprot:jgi/Chrpa1/24151/Chrysochromulina_OHIO_Genome00007274-RA
MVYIMACGGEATLYWTICGCGGSRGERAASAPDMAPDMAGVPAPAPPYGLPGTKAFAAALSLDFIDKGGLEGASPPAAGASTEGEPPEAGGAAGSAGVAGAVMVLTTARVGSVPSLVSTIEYFASSSSSSLSSSSLRPRSSSTCLFVEPFFSISAAIACALASCSGVYLSIVSFVVYKSSE